MNDYNNNYNRQYGAEKQQQQQPPHLYGSYGQSAPSAAVAALSPSQQPISHNEAKPADRKANANWLVRLLLKHYGNTEYIRSPEDIKADERVFGGLLPFSKHGIVPAAIITQFCCGTLYSWSSLSDKFQEYLWPLQPKGQNSINAFYLAVGSFGIVAAIMGPWIERSAPRRSSSVGAMLFLLGNILTAVTFFTQQPWLLFVGYSVVGAAGLGISYVTTASVVQKWYPNARGLAAGFAVCGFGGGALAFTKVRVAFYKSMLKQLTANGSSTTNPGSDEQGRAIAFTFLIEAAMFFVLMIVCGELFRAPPPGLNLNGVALQEDSKGRVYKADHKRYAGGMELSDDAEAGVGRASNGGYNNGSNGLGGDSDEEERPTIKITLIQALTSRDFWMLYFVFFANQFFGLAVISRIGNICRDVFYNNPHSQYHYLDSAQTKTMEPEEATSHAATWVVVDGAFNILGRVLMAGLSDHIGRKTSFIIMLTSQILLVAVGLQISLNTDSLYGFLASAWLATFFYGGGFGVIPAFLADMFGPYNVSACHGLMLTAWAIGGVVGGLVLSTVVGNIQTSSSLKEHDPYAYNANLYWILAVMIIGWILLIFMRSMLRDRLFPAVPGQWLRLRLFGRMVRITKPFNVEFLSKAQEEAEWEEFLMMCIIRLRLVKNEAESNSRAQAGANNAHGIDSSVMGRNYDGSFPNQQKYSQNGSSTGGMGGVGAATTPGYHTWPSHLMQPPQLQQQQYQSNQSGSRNTYVPYSKRN
ncbi:MFS general substrate transporter [Ramicandelaber brevisporus]|nr:MFS general substrate transporter [Ramicandelaber brevisporus]